ncbi:OadG family protein [Bacteroides helcogenes]|uniref:Sodium pump decarboxylase gamma subunit n=1 Tax=Bacteroides helcogenes (strain ATCC 35417 / DSM 20613 / JCM 6297 / CCUG 15421 / P 36-108) TaxID=693979 RepID=E6SQG0_BACT6|nr:OadG family protein [Bacteroides helcogenes]ADV45007.1 sodium pump decarboxylase gamma subunit [Bacteroides helcogenes P 36-108]MDY5239866.1 OadG family protein [Bacteroides helcogenes]
MENLNTALLLMVVGMATVFAILLIVINLGKGLIALVNKYAPEEAVPSKVAANVPAPIPGNIMAAINAAVTVVTQGKGKVAKIEKIK